MRIFYTVDNVIDYRKKYRAKYFGTVDFSDYDLEEEVEDFLDDNDEEDLEGTDLEESLIEMLREEEVDKTFGPETDICKIYFDNSEETMPAISRIFGRKLNTSGLYTTTPFFDMNYGDVLGLVTYYALDIIYELDEAPGYFAKMDIEIIADADDRVVNIINKKSDGLVIVKDDPSGYDYIGYFRTDYEKMAEELEKLLVD